MLSKNYSKVKSNLALQFGLEKFIPKKKIIILINFTVFRLHVACKTIIQKIKLFLKIFQKLLQAGIKQF